MASPLKTNIKHILRKLITKDLVLDLEDRTKAEAIKAFEMVRDKSGLDQKRARELEGQARFRMMEQGFVEVCALYGGRELDGGLIPKTDLKVFQPFMRFEKDGVGVILALAAMPEPNTVPSKNMSRLSGVSVNYHLSPRLDFDGTSAKMGDLFALFLVARDKKKSGKIEEIAMGVVDAEYESFLFYEPLEKFMTGIADANTDAPNPSSNPSFPVVGVSLKKAPKPFIPPEAPKPPGIEKNKKS